MASRLAPEPAKQTRPSDHSARPPKQEKKRSRALILIAVLCAVAFLPRGDWDPLANTLVAFICALQVETFRKVRGNPFATTMCTGNLRSGTEAIYHGLTKRERAGVEKGLCYYGVIACFIAGAALGVLLTKLAPQRAVLGAAVLQLAAFGLMCREDGGGK